ncbi:hypothetical protein MLD52_17205 [Puniceicoccaceae bacterium K14]|nr:hypothetical protein [Puniceicoccaceae bacterium K14]
MSQNSSDSPKKHKVIHWNPEDEEKLESQSSSSKKLLIFGVVAITAILVAGGLGFYAISTQTNAGDNERDGQASPGEPNIQEAFVSRSKADFAQETTTKKIEAAREMPANHQVLTQKLIAVEKEFLLAETFMKRSNYAKALTQYDRVSELIDGFSEEVKNKQTSRELYDSFLSRVEYSEDKKYLNEAAYEAAFEAASTGKQFLDAGSFSIAKSKLDEAAVFLSDLENSINEYVQKNASQGHRLIAQGQGGEAIAAFMNVLKMAPDNEDAIIQLERAKYAKKTHSLLLAAKLNEDQGQLEEALENYEQAFAIDSRSAKSQQGVSRVRRKIENRDFNFHYTSAANALNDLRYDDAIEHLEKALEVFPTRTDIADAIGQTKADKRQSDIVSMVTQAYSLEHEYQWKAARNIYEELLEIEPELEEAKNGMLRTGKMIRTILRYEKLIEVAKVEAKSLSFQRSIRTFDSAMKSKPAYLALTPENENLRRYLQLQSKPVSIEISSDNQTWVSIEGPSKQKPAKLEKETFNLLPGRYLIRGRKNKYESVRYSLIIRGGTTQEPLSVICDKRAK